MAAAMAAAAPAVWDWDVQTQQFNTTARLREIYGVPKDQSMDFAAFLAVTHPDDAEWMRTLCSGLLTLEGFANGSRRYRIRRADTQDIRWLNLDLQVAHNPDNPQELQALTGTVEDITEQVEAGHALIESGERLRLAIEAGRMALWEVDLGSGSLTITPQLNRLFGFPSDARPSFAEFRSRYAPGELEKLGKEGATLEAVRQRLARGDFELRRMGDPTEGADRTQVQAEVTIMLPSGVKKRLLYRAQCVFALDGRPRITGLLIDITDRKLMEERLAVIARELQHRVKNSLAVVQSLAVQSMRSHADTASGMDAFLGRLRALAMATDMVLDKEAPDTGIHDIVHSITTPYRKPDEDPFTITGPPLQLSGKLATTLGMILHELCTNAVKYGALSNPAGHVSLSWTVSPDQAFVLKWEEQGGPRFVAPTRKGFGTRLIEALVARDLGGTLEMNFEPAGFRCTIAALLPPQQGISAS